MRPAPPPRDVDPGCYLGVVRSLRLSGGLAPRWPLWAGLCGNPRHVGPWFTADVIGRSDKDVGDSRRTTWIRIKSSKGTGMSLRTS